MENKNPACKLSFPILPLLHSSMLRKLVTNSFLDLSAILKQVFIVGLLVILFGYNYSAQAATFYTRATGNWSNANTWSIISCGGAAAAGIPGIGDDVIICNDYIITVDGTFSCATLTINSGNRTSAVIIPLTRSLTVTGATIITSNSNNRYKYVQVNGNFSTTSLTTNSNGSTRDAFLEIVEGTATITGDITMIAADNRSNYILFSGNGTLNVGGTITGGTITSASGGGATPPTSGTVNYNNSGNQVVGQYEYFNLTLSGSGSKTMAGVTVDGTLSMEGTATASAAPVYGGAAVLQYKGSAAQISGPEFTASVYELTVDNSLGLTLNSSKEVTHLLRMSNGNITTGGNILYLSNPDASSLENSSDFTIIGSFRRAISITPLTDYEFPVGTATLKTPAVFNFSSLASPIDITAHFVNTPPALGSSYLDGMETIDRLFTEGYWNFQSSGVPAANYNLSLTGTGFTSYPINEVSRISGNDDSNTSWRALGTHGSVTGNTITRTGVTNLNTSNFNFAFGTGCTSVTLGYDYERDISIDYTKIGGSSDLSNFPVLINLGGEDFLKQSPTGKILNSSGFDIIFTDEDYNQLDHQIEYYNGTNGDLIAWVRIPTLSHSANTTIKILYGNSQITTDQSVTSVWDTHYKGVWHLDNNALQDFTSYNKAGTPYNSPTYPAGRIYNALSLIGGNKYVEVINAPNTNFNGNLTVSGWIYLNGTGLDQKIAGNQDGTSGGYKFGVYSNNKLEFEIRNSSNVASLNRAVTGGTVLTTGQWYYVAGISSDVLDSIKTFVNGIPERPFRKSGILGTSSNTLTIGKEPFQSLYFFNGNIDELRLSDEVRSNGWLRTEYNNQLSPSTFYSIDAVDTPSNNLPSSSICLGPVTLTFGYPAGGTYSTTDPSQIVGDVFTPPSAGTYSITYTLDAGCGPTSITKDFIITDTPSAPIAPNMEYCTGTIAYLHATSGDNVKWYEGGLLVSTANPFSTGKTAVGTYNYTVTQTLNGCESAPVPVTLTIFASTNITTQPAGLTKCVGADATFSIVATGPNLTYQWMKGATALVDGGSVSGAASPDLTITNVQLTDAANYTCIVSSSCGAPITSDVAALQVDAAPAPAINGNNVVCPFSTVNYFTALVGGHTYLWTAVGGTINGSNTGSSINVDWGAVGAGSVSVTETVSAGCFTTQNYIVNMVDGGAPTIVGCPSNITVNATAGACTAVVNWVEPSATDLCTSAGNLVWTKSHVPGTSFPVGTTTVTYTVADQTGNESAPCSFTVTVADNQLPTIIPPAPVTVGNDAGICTASGVVLGVPTTADNCTVASVTNDAPVTFPLGLTTVTWTVTDDAGNSATATQDVTVIDNELPIALCKSITVNLDISGNAVILPSDIDNGSTDNCGIASVTVAPDTFDSSNIGGNTVTLTVTDNSGNVSTCTSTVTVLNNNPPTAICKDVTVFLGAGGTVTITGATVDNGSNDPDGIASLVVTPNTFTCSEIGDNAVVLTVTDNAGMVSTCNATVTVVDNMLPTISCPGNINVNVDPGICGAVVNFLTPVGLDNCSGPVTSQTLGLASGSVFPVGTTTNTFLVTDGSGNTASCSFTVTVLDNEKPVIVLPVPPVINANAGCQAPIPAIAATISDNCTPLGSLVITQVPAAGTIVGLGVTTVTISATDLAGNLQTSDIDVTVVDVTKPVITTPLDITQNLDVNCEALVPDFLASLVVTDNCTAPGALVLVQTPAAGTVISGDASTNIQIDATDESGNTQSVTVLFITNDVTPPTVICKDINLYLDASGNATLSGADIDNGSVDNCSAVVSLSLSKSAFNCSDIGSPVSVVLTGMDASLNSATCTSNVTVLDTVKPIVNTKTFDLVLDPLTGSGTLLASDVDNLSYDNCSAITLSVSPNTFDCGDQGSQTVVLTAVDAYGNSKSKSVVITVSSTLEITDLSLSECDLAAPFALYSSTVSGGDETYSYLWSVTEVGVNPFVYLDGNLPFIHFTNVSTAATPFFNNLMPDGLYNINLSVSDGNGCTDNSSFVLNKGGIEFNNITEINSDACEGETKTYSVAAGATSYNWHIDNGTIIGPDNTNTATVTWDMGAVSGLLVANILKPDLLGNDCGSSVENTVTIHALPAPVFSAAPVSVCSGSEYTYTLSSTFTSHAWTVVGGSISDGGASDENFVKVIWGGGPAGSVSVDVTNGSGCTNSVSAAVTINALPLPTLTSSDLDNTFCAGTSVTFTAGGGTSYNFRVNTTTVQNGASSTYTTTTLTNGQVVDVIVTNGSGCTSTSAGITNTVIAYPTATLTSSDADNSFCVGTSVTFTAAGGTNFEFRVNTTTVQNSGSPTYTTSSLANGDIVDVIVKNAGGCSTTSAGITNTVIALPAPTLTSNDADNTFCAGTSVTFTAGGGSLYTFRVDGVNVQNGASNTYTTTGLTNGQVVDVIVENASTCTAVSTGITNTVVALPAPVLSSTDADNIICAGTSVTFSSGGGTNYKFRVNSTIVQDGPSADYTTTTLTNGQVVDVIVTNAGGCSGTSAGRTMTVTTLPVATISYTGSPWCSTAGINSVTLTGTTGGTFSAPAGLTIDPSTGDITPSSSTAGTYTVTYTIPAAGGCGVVTAITSVTVTALPTAVISYTGSPWCTSAPAQTVTLTGTSGGIYSALPAGLSINSGTGAITPGTSTAGTYTVTYTIAAAGGCSVVTATATVQITALPTATITYPGSPYCNSIGTAQSVNLVGTTGGVFSSTPAGLTLNSSTGEVTPSTSTAGLYSVTYTIAAAGGCSVVTATAPVTITALPVATFNYTGGSFCNNAVDPLPTFSGGGVPGIFSSTPGLIFVDTSTGQVDLSASTPGSYTVVNTIAAAGGCGIVTSSSPITITALPTAAISYPGSPYCSTAGIQNVVIRYNRRHI